MVLATAISKEVLLNFPKRSLLYLGKNLSKSLALFLAVFVLGCVVSGAILVRQAMQNADVALRGNMPTVVIVEQDFSAVQEYEAFTGRWPEMSALSPEVLDEIGDLPYVRRHDYSVEAFLLSSELQRYTSLDHALSMDSGMGSEWTQLELKGVRNANFFEVEEGVIELVSGRLFSEQEVSNLTYVALISQNFADTNSLGIGSSLTIQNIVWNMQDHLEIDENFYVEENIFAQRSYTFEIIGIFEPQVEYDTGDEWIDIEFQNQIENLIYVPSTVSIASNLYQSEHMAVMELGEKYRQANFDEMILYHNIYVLYDFADMKNFAQAVERIAPEFYTATYTSDTFQNITSVMQSISQLAIAVLWVAIIASVTILSLLIVLFIRERRQEIGILLALGERRGVIVLQAISEVLIVALIAVVLSLFVGSLISGSISESMLMNDLIAGQAADQNTTFSNLDRMGFSNNVSIEEVLASYSVSLDLPTIAIFFAIGIGVVIISIIIPMLYILRLNPRKIMM